MKRVKKFTFGFSCLLCGRIYPFFNIHKELPLKLQKISNFFSHPHSVKITREYSHSYRIKLSIFSPFFCLFPVFSLVTNVETVNLKKNNHLGFNSSCKHTGIWFPFLFFFPIMKVFDLQKLRLWASIQDFNP